MYIKTLVEKVSCDSVVLKILQNFNDYKNNPEFIGIKLDIRISNKFKTGYKRVLVLNNSASIEIKNNQIIHIGLSNKLSSREISKYEMGWLFEIKEDGSVLVTGDNTSMNIFKNQTLLLALTSDDANDCLFKEVV